MKIHNWRMFWYLNIKSLGLDCAKNCFNVQRMFSISSHLPHFFFLSIFFRRRLVYIKPEKERKSESGRNGISLQPTDNSPHRHPLSSREMYSPHWHIQPGRASHQHSCTRLFQFSSLSFSSSRCCALLYIVEGFGEKFDVGWGFSRDFLCQHFSLSRFSLLWIFFAISIHFLSSVTLKLS